MVIKRGYITLALDCTHIGWPLSEQTVDFRGQKILVRSGNDKDSPSISIEFSPDFPELQARKIMNEFLSSYSWREDGGVYEKWNTCNTAGPMRVGKGPYGSRYDSPIVGLLEPQNQRQKMALALWREGQSVNLLQYKFLGYYKVIDLLCRDRGKQIKWINDHVDHISNAKATTCLAELRKTRNNIGSYLYDQGRCAIAHAFSSDSVNPDDSEDIYRLGYALPLIKSLAVYAMVNEFKLKKPRFMK